MTEELTGRIQEVMKEYSYTPSVFADEIGVQRPAISHILSGRNRPSLDIVLKILKKFPKINSHWLLTGEGKMIQLNLFGQPEAPQNTEPSISEKIEPEVKIASSDNIQNIENQLVTSHSSRDLNTGISPDISPATANSQTDHFQVSARVLQGDTLNRSLGQETPLSKDVSSVNGSDSLEVDVHRSAQSGNYSLPNSKEIPSPLPHTTQIVEKQILHTDNQRFNNNSSGFTDGTQGNQNQLSGFSGQRLSPNQANPPHRSGFPGSEYDRQFNPGNTQPYFSQNPGQDHVRAQFDNHNTDNQSFRSYNSRQEHYQSQLTDPKTGNGAANRQPLERSHPAEHYYDNRNHNQQSEYQYFRNNNHLNRPEDMSPDRQFNHPDHIHGNNHYGHYGRSPQHSMEYRRSVNHFYDYRDGFNPNQNQHTDYKHFNQINHHDNYSGYQQSGYSGENRYFPPAVNDGYRYYNTPQNFHPHFNSHPDPYFQYAGMKYNDQYVQGYPEHRTPNTQNTNYQHFNNQYRDFNRFPEHTPAGFNSPPIPAGSERSGERHNPVPQEGFRGQQGQSFQNNVNFHPSEPDNQRNTITEAPFTDPRQANLFPDYQSIPLNDAPLEGNSRIQTGEIKNHTQSTDNQNTNIKNSANQVYPATSRNNGITPPSQESHYKATVSERQQVPQSGAHQNNSPAEPGQQIAENRKLSDYEVINMAQNLLQAAESGRKPEKIIIFWSDKTFGIYSPEP